MTVNRQTTSFLRSRFEEAGIRPVTRYGQNFLIDLNLIELLVDSANLSKDDVVLEIGTGTGALTGMMVERAAHVVSVEVDARLHQLASEELADNDNKTLLLQDALHNKNTIDNRVLQAVRDALETTGAGGFKFVANLPYNIATPLISNLLLTDITPKLMVVTIQKELADRIVAGPGTKDYGALSVWVQSQCDTEIIRILPPTVFWPRPKVHSGIIRVRPDEQKRAAIPDLPFFHTFVRSMFFHRRKFLRSVMIAAFKRELKKANIDHVMERMQLGPDARAEQLNVAQMLALYECVREELASVDL